MAEQKRDKTKVDPLSGGEEPQPAEPLQTTVKGDRARAKDVVIPGTGQVIKDLGGNEAKRVTRT